MSGWTNEQRHKQTDCVSPLSMSPTLSQQFGPVLPGSGPQTTVCFFLGPSAQVSGPHPLSRPESPRPQPVPPAVLSPHPGSSSSVTQASAALSHSPPPSPSDLTAVHRFTSPLGPPPRLARGRPPRSGLL